MLFFFSLPPLLYWLISDYQHLKAQMPRIGHLEKENSQQRMQFAHLTGRIDLIREKMNKLKKLDRQLRIMVNLEQSEDETPFQGVGGSEPGPSGPRDSSEKVDGQEARRAQDPLVSQEDLANQGGPDIRAHHGFPEDWKLFVACRPSISPTKGWVSSRFGCRVSPITGEKEFQRGICISTGMNAPVFAPADGIVSDVGSDPVFGKMLTIKHGYGMVTRYAHLSKTLLKNGQYVARGEKIALVGSSGSSTGPQLYYEVIFGQVPVDPLHFLDQ